MGWTLGHFEGLKTASHGGMGFGWTDFLVLLPEKKLGAIIMCNEESWARSRTRDAVARAMLDLEPQVGTVSWMVPICRALESGGIQAAYARYAELKDDSSGVYHFDGDDLANLSIQMESVEKIDLAIEVLGLNLQVFPEHIESYIRMACLYSKRGDNPQAEEILRKALAIQPDNETVAEMLMKKPI